MEFFLIELTVADWLTSVAWYRDRFGLRLELLDETHCYDLFTVGPARIAIKEGTCVAGSFKIAMRVDDLDAQLLRLIGQGIEPNGPIKISGEGYRSVRINDPSGYRIELFEWTHESQH